MSIFTHVMVGSNDLERSRQFYDAVLGTLEIKFLGNMGERLMYGKEGPQFMCTKPINGKEATYANGGTIGFSAPDRAAVEAFHKAVLANGGKVESGPEPSANAPQVYGVWVRDPDGNKLCAVSLTSE